jgi:hypothetical protein
MKLGRCKRSGLGGVAAPASDPAGNGTVATPYERRCDTGWASEVLAHKCRISVTDHEIALQATCTNCEHELDDYIALDRRFARRLAKGDACILQDADTLQAPTESILTVLSCNCDSKHEGRPEDAHGCGRFAGLHIEIEAAPRKLWRPQMRSKPRLRLAVEAASGQDKVWDDRAADQEGSMLMQLRELAEKWGATLGTLLGLFGIAVVAGAIDTVRDLDEGYRIALAVLAALTALAGLGAIALAAQAAQGKAHRVNYISGREVRRIVRQDTKDARAKLKWSRRFAATATLLGIAGAVVLLLAPEGSGAKDKVAVRTDAEELCGKLAEARPGYIGVTLADSGRTSFFSSESVTSIAQVDKCP